MTNEKILTAHSNTSSKLLWFILNKENPSFNASLFEIDEASLIQLHRIQIVLLTSERYQPGLSS